MWKVNFFFEDIKRFTLNRKLISFYLKELVTSESFKFQNLSLIFCSDEYLFKMNKEYLNHEYYTDIITFNNSEGNIISGDLFISIDRVKENATTFGESFECELYRVIFHGVLHLIGFDDSDEELSKEIREKEDFYLRKFDIRK